MKNLWNRLLATSLRPRCLYGASVLRVMAGCVILYQYLINYAQYNFAVPDMYAGIITISVIGLVINQLLVAVERRFSTWRTS